MCILSTQEENRAGKESRNRSYFIQIRYVKEEQSHGLFFMKENIYYTQGSESRIMLWETSDITNLNDSLRKPVWIPTDPSNSHHLWAPEMHRINNKWYIYFAADDGNMDNHQIYVIENEADIPTEGKFVMKGRIPTDKDNNWAIHASTFEHNGQRYMIWCGWQKRRIDSETQCIYIASMKKSVDSFF